MQSLDHVQFTLRNPDVACLGPFLSDVKQGEVVTDNQNLEFQCQCPKQFISFALDTL